MDRLNELANELSQVLTDIRTEAAERELRSLAAPLGWLDEANWWLRTELSRIYMPAADAVPFTYIPVEFRQSR